MFKQFIQSAEKPALVVGVDADQMMKELTFFTNEVSKGFSWMMSAADRPERVIYNGVTTIAIYPGGEKKISRPNHGEKFDPETGLAMCIVKHVYGSYSAFLRAVEGATVQNKPEACEAKEKMVIYLAGSIRPKGNQTLEMNLAYAKAAALELWKKGYVVICPHANSDLPITLAEKEAESSVWLGGDLELISRSDALVVLPGWTTSEGTKGEIMFAIGNHIPVHYYPDLPELVKRSAE